MSAQELKVLLIEDNPGDAFLMKFYLGESTSPVFHVSHAETVKAALDLLAENKFDLILSDMNLSDSFGVETIKAILGKFPGNLVIVLTGLTDEEVGLETVRYGAQDFLVKGKFDGKVLISSVMFAFERFKLHRQIDKVSKQLDAENTRLDSIQRLMNVGYVEYDDTGKSFFQTSYALELSAAGPGTKTDSLEGFILLSDQPEELRKLLQQVIQSGGTGDIVYKKYGGTEYRLRYEG